MQRWHGQETWSPSSIVKQPPVLGEKQPEFDQSCGGTRKTPPTLAWGVMNGSGNVSLKNQWTLVLGLFVLFVLFCSHTLPQPRKALKQFSIGLFPAEKSFEGRKKSRKWGTKQWWTQAEQRGERSGVQWPDRLVTVEPIEDGSTRWTVMRTWAKSGSADLENGGTMLQNLQPLNTNGIQ